MQITIGRHEYEISPELANEAGIERPTKFDYDGPVNYGIMNFVQLLATDEDLTPMVDMISHEGLYESLKVAEVLGFRPCDLTSRLASWVLHKRWVDLERAEYMYKLSLEYPDLVDYDRFFREHGSPFAHLADTVELTKAAGDGKAFLRMLTFYKTYDFTTCFNGGSDEIRERVSFLIAERAKVSHLFLVDPHDNLFCDYFTRVQSYADVWSCDEIAKMPRPAVGSPVIVDRATVNDRMRAFTCGLLDAPVNPEATTPFPFENVVIAGGSVLRLLQHTSAANRAADVDLFIIAPDYAQRAEIFDKVVDWFRGPKTYFAVNGSVATIYIKGVQRKFQVISVNMSTQFDVIGRFDMTHVMWLATRDAAGQYKVVGTPESFESVCTRVTRVFNEARSKLNRVIKALYAGYDVSKVTTKIDLDPIFAEPTRDTITKTIRQIHDCWFPEDRVTDDPEEEHQHILCMIEKDSKSTFVTSDAATVRDRIKISGNFETGYDSISFATFNPSTIVNVIHTADTFTIQDARGRIRLSTPFLTVSEFADGDDIKITVDVNNAFRAFCAELETHVWPMFRRQGVPARPDKKIIEDGKITFDIGRYKIEYQAVTGISILSTQRGEALNVEEDIKVGDLLQVAFCIRISRGRQVNAITLMPIRLVKYQCSMVRIDRAISAPATGVDTPINYEML